MGLSSDATSGRLAASANVLAALAMVKDLRARDKVLVMAFAVCCAFLFGDHLSFTANFQPSLIVPVLVGKLCADAGVGLYLHPHWGTYIETENQIDLLLEHTNRDYLNLCLDTAHTTLCGMNPAKLFDKYLRMGVVKYIHMKDINGDPDSYPEYPPRRFRALGYGIVDFPAVQKVLQKHGYDGVLCVELDFNRVNNYDSAKRSRQYIHDVLGY